MSALRVKANTERGTQFYVNNAAILAGDRFNASGVALAAGSGNDVRSAIGAAGLIVVRDMGKTLLVPINSLSSTVAATKFRLLRKVQLIDTTSMSAAATVGGNSNTDGVSDLGNAVTGLLPGGTFYIEFGGLLADGTTALAVKWSSLNIPY
jgi:hypothetical protein